MPSTMPTAHPCVNDLDSEGWAIALPVPVCRHAGVVAVINGWWVENRSGHTLRKRHRLRIARDSEGRRIAACGVRAPNGWTEAGESVGVECQACAGTAAIDELER
jgi:hypothetical protein